MGNCFFFVFFCKWSEHVSTYVRTSAPTSTCLAYMLQPPLLPLLLLALALALLAVAVLAYFPGSCYAVTHTMPAIAAACCELLFFDVVIVFHLVFCSVVRERVGCWPFDRRRTWRRW